MMNFDSWFNCLFKYFIKILVYSVFGMCILVISVYSSVLYPIENVICMIIFVNQVVIYKKIMWVKHNFIQERWCSDSTETFIVRILSYHPLDITEVMTSKNQPFKWMKWRWLENTSRFWSEVSEKITGTLCSEQTPRIKEKKKSKRLYTTFGPVVSDS